MHELVFDLMNEHSITTTTFDVSDGMGKISMTTRADAKALDASQKDALRLSGGSGDNG